MFWKKYGIKIIIFLAFILILSYLFFTMDGFIPTGLELEKASWLGFWAGYLSFAGALFLGAVALWQNKKANEINDKLVEFNTAQMKPIVIIEVDIDKKYFPRKSSKVEEPAVYVANFRIENSSKNLAYNFKFSEIKVINENADEINLNDVRGSKYNYKTLDYGFLKPDSFIEKEMMLAEDRDNKNSPICKLCFMYEYKDMIGKEYKVESIISITDCLDRYRIDNTEIEYVNVK